VKHNGDFLLTNTAAPISFSTFSSDDPSVSVTITDLAAGDVYIHKNGSNTAGTPGGKTVRIDADGITGNHIIVLDLTDTTDAGFYANGAFYTVRIEGATVDGGTINAWVGSFTIGMMPSATDVTAILADTNEMQADQADGGRLDLIWDATLADTNELQTDWADGGRLDAKLDLAAAAAGAGAATISMTNKDTGNTAIPGADVWIATDEAGTTVVAGKLVTDTFGLTTFYLDAGTYYVFRQRSGYTFTNPQTLVVTVTASVTYNDGVAAATGTGESGLSGGYPDFKSEVGFYLGYGRSNFTSAQTTEIDGIIQSGIRQVYYPPALSEETVGHEWSWLRPSTTLQLSLPYSTGTVTIASGVVTLASGTWPTWAANGSLQTSAGRHTIATRTSGTSITLDDTSVDLAAGAEYTLYRDEYDLPDDFGRMHGTFHYPINEYREDIEKVAAGQIMSLLASRDDTGAPYWYATEYKRSTGTNGQRQKAMFYPTPDTAWLLRYQYEAFQGALSTTNPYPLGGMKYTELYIESCLAVAERRIHDAPSVHDDQFKSLLADAVRRDRRSGAQVFGNMGHQEEVDEMFRRGWTGGTYPITYDGSEV
jgi:hypothetical protein